MKKNNKITKTILLNVTDEFYYLIKNNSERNRRSMGSQIQWIVDKYFEDQEIKSRIEDEDEFPEDKINY